MLELKTFFPVNDIFLLETDIDKVKSVDYEQSDSGIFTGKTSIIDSRVQYGKIIKMGENVPKGYDVNDVEKNPKEYLTDDIRAEASDRYIQLYEKMTGEKFEFPDAELLRTETIELVLNDLV